MEHDSGVPSQEFDRYDALERENSLLQSKLDDVIVENVQQRTLVTQLKENNANLDASIQNLTRKLEKCSQRLKDVEEANHMLGREALRRSQTFGGDKTELLIGNLNELKLQNEQLQDKVKHLSEVEKLVEDLQEQIKNEKESSLLFTRDNEKLKMKISKMTDTIRNLEESKADTEKSLRILIENNRELDDDVKRLEQKLEIYSELFGKDASRTGSYRHSYNSEAEREEERMLENALAPLMEEINEKATQIKKLEQQVLEKDQVINSLMAEVESLETNLSSMVTEKIERMRPLSTASAADSYTTEYPTSRPDSIVSEDLRRDRKSSFSDFTAPDSRSEFTTPESSESKPSSGSSTQYIEQANDDDVFHKKGLKQISQFVITDEESVDELNEKAQANLDSDEEYTVTKQQFYYMLDEQGKLLKKKDDDYYRHSGSDGEATPPLAHTDKSNVPVSSSVPDDNKQSKSTSSSTSSTTKVSSTSITLRKTSSSLPINDTSASIEVASHKTESSDRTPSEIVDIPTRTETTPSSAQTWPCSPKWDALELAEQQLFSQLNDADDDEIVKMAQMYIEKLTMNRNSSTPPVFPDVTDTVVSDVDTVEDTKKLVGDMYDQLAELENLVTGKTDSTITNSVKESSKYDPTKRYSLEKDGSVDITIDLNMDRKPSAIEIVDVSTSSQGDIDGDSIVTVSCSDIRDSTTLPSQTESSFSDSQLTNTGDNLTMQILPRFPFSSQRISDASRRSSGASSYESKSSNVDLTMLDDLLTEVNTRGVQLERKLSDSRVSLKFYLYHCICFCSVPFLIEQDHLRKFMCQS